MPESEVVERLNAAMRVVDPQWVDVVRGDNELQQIGCSTDPSTLMPDGPPWRYRMVRAAYPESSYPALRSGLDELASLGFSVGAPRRSDDRRDALATDPDGFSVTIRVLPGERVTVDADSPCVEQ